MVKDKNGKEIRKGYFIFDTYSGEFGNVVEVDEDKNIKVDFLNGEDICSASEIEVEDTSPRGKVDVLGFCEWEI